MSSFIVASCDKLLRDYPDAGVVLTGDFNSLDTNHFNKYLNLSQIVKEPARKNNILDKIFTNFSKLYASPFILSAVGKSDHNCILVKPKYYYAHNKAVSRVVTKQYLSKQVHSRFTIRGDACPLPCVNAEACLAGWPNA